MNRIYRKVWNRALGQWVVASELARGDSAGVTGARRRTLPHRLALVIALMAGGMTAGAQANTVIGSNSFVSPDGAICSAVGTPAANAVAAWTCQVPNGSSGYAIISGINATATGAPNLAGLASALGANAVLIGTTATRASADGTVAIGPDARATADTAIALGDRARATGVGAVALGFSARAEDEYSAAVGAGAVALGRSSYAMGNNAVARDFDVAIGAAALIGSTSSARTTAIGYQAGANAPNAVESSFIGFAAGAQSDGTSNTFIGSRAGFLATGDLNVANGTFALAAANGNHNVAQGNGAGALVTGDHNVAIGRQAGTLTTFAADGTPTVLTPAAFSESISIGREAGGLANRAIAIGAEAVATGTASIALGPAANTSATALDSVAIGRESTVIGAGSIAAGFGATAAADRSIAIGRSANTEGRFSVALGSNAEALDQHSIALGSARSEGQYSIAAGIGATARGSDTLAIGTNTLTGGFNAIAIGTGAQAEIDDAVALGSNAIADTPSGLAGYDPRTGLASTGTSSTWVSTLAAVSIGSAGNTRQITNVAAGTEATDAVNVAQLQAAQTRYYSVNDSFAASFPWPPSNYNNDGAQSLFGMAIGPYASALSGWDIAIGAGATTVNSIGFAGGAVALGGMATADVQGVAVGTLANVSAFGGAAVGAGANASGMLSVALGGGFVSWDVPNDVGDVSDPVDAFAGANASGDRAVAVGHNAIASLDDGVALGSNSVTTTAAGAAGYDPSTGAASANTSPTWVSTLAAVSVGGAGNTRQITNVAAGTEDTDAVNVAQLRAVSTAASAGWNATDAAGNTANIGPGGTVLFEGDANIAVSQTGTDDDGVVQITLNRDLDVDSVTAGGAVLDTAGLTIAGGPSVTIAGINAGGTVITNVAAGVAPTDAVNVSQLTTVETAANAGWNATDAAGNTANIGPNGTVTFESGNANIAVSQNGTDDDGVVGITLSNDLDLTAAGSVTTGDTVVNNAGVAVGTNVALGSGGLTVIGGTTTTIVSGTGVSSGNVVLSGVSNDITGLSNRTLADPTFATAGRAATEEQLRLVRNEITSGFTPPTRYYGVNSLGGGNQLGEGATGEDAMALGKDAVSEGEEAIAMGRGARATEDDSMALGAGSQALSLNALAIGAGALASHENSIALGAGSATTVGARAGYQGAYVGSSSSTGELNIGGRQLTGVAAGSAATDAVNVSQLQGGVTYAITEANSYTDARLATIEGDLIDIRGDITDIQGDIVRIEGDITNLGNRVGDVEGSVANLTTTVNQFDNRVTNLERGGSGPFQVTQGEPYVAPAPTGANASAGGNGAVASGDNSTAVGNQSVASGDNSTAIGQGAVASHDNSVALGRGSATTVGAQRGYNAAYVGTSTSTGEVNIGGRTLSGVAPGIAGTDAVNVNQLNAGVDYAINQANAYTDNRFNQFEGDMWNLERGYRGGTASAMAMAGLPQAYLPGKSMLSVAFGGYQGEYGMAFGLSTITDNGRWVYKAQATGNTTRDWGFSVGAGLQW